MDETTLDSLNAKFESFLKFQPVEFTEAEQDQIVSIWLRMMPEKAIFSLLHYDNELEKQLKIKLNATAIDQDINMDELAIITKAYHDFDNLFKMIVMDITYRLVINVYDNVKDEQINTSPFNPQRS